MAKASKKQDTLSGIIEVDEFFMASSEKGSKPVIPHLNLQLN
jgi:hypothetical protein